MWRRFLEHWTLCSLFRNWFSFEEELTLNLNKREKPSSQEYLMPSSVEISLMVLKNLSQISYHLPFEMNWSCIWINLKILLTNMFCAKFNWNLAGCSNYLPFKEELLLHMNKLESPFPQGNFVISLVEIGLVVLKFEVKSTDILVYHTLKE